MDQKSIKPAIINYLSELKKQIKVDKALLFGSYTSNKADSASDIDLLIISSDFTKIDNDDRSRILYKASIKFPYDLHVYGVTQEELNQASSLTTLGSLRQKTSILIS